MDKQPYNDFSFNFPSSMQIKPVQYYLHLGFICS